MLISVSGLQNITMRLSSLASLIVKRKLVLINLSLEKQYLARLMLEVMYR